MTSDSPCQTFASRRSRSRASGAAGAGATTSNGVAAHGADAKLTDLLVTLAKLRESALPRRPRPLQGEVRGLQLPSRSDLVDQRRHRRDRKRPRRCRHVAARFDKRSFDYCGRKVLAACGDRGPADGPVHPWPVPPIFLSLGLAPNWRSKSCRAAISALFGDASSAPRRSRTRPGRGFRRATRPEAVRGQGVGEKSDWPARSVAASFRANKHNKISHDKLCAPVRGLSTKLPGSRAPTLERRWSAKLSPPLAA
jgi:hypothetical protein